MVADDCGGGMIHMARRLAMWTNQDFSRFPDSTFMIMGLLVYALLTVGTPQIEGLGKFLSYHAQTQLSLCLLVSSVIALVGLIVMRWDVLLGGWIHAGGIAGLNIGLSVYVYVLVQLAGLDKWWHSPTFWFLAGLILMFASRLTRVCIFNYCVFVHATHERKWKRRLP